jgi:hypothetical protein
MTRLFVSKVAVSNHRRNLQIYRYLTRSKKGMNDKQIRQLIEAYANRGWNLTVSPTECVAEKLYPGDEVFTTLKADNISEIVDQMDACDQAFLASSNDDESDDFYRPEDEKEDTALAVYVPTEIGHSDIAEAIDVEVEDIEDEIEPEKPEHHTYSIERCKVDLTVEELADRGRLLGEKNSELRLLDEEKKRVAKEYDARMKVCLMEVMRHEAAISSKSEYRPVECIHNYDYDKGLVYTVRTDTGEEISSRVMSADERQGVLFDD